MRHIFRWSSIDGVGTEYLKVDFAADGTVASGVVVGEDEGVPYGLVYTVRTDAEWRTRAVEVAHPADGRCLRLLSDGEGRWSDALTGEYLPLLDGCIDVDIAATPFTNTLPIRRRPWTSGLSRTFSMAYVSVPELVASKKEQRYTCVEEKKKFLFETLPPDFQAELTIDGDGVVVDYPGLFRRLP